MRFLLRIIFWLTVVILVLPSNPEGGPDAPQVSFVEALNAVRATISDFSQFCVRNPDLCETGEAVVQVVADKARYGIEQLQAYLEVNGIGDTLTDEDIATPWQGIDETAAVAGG